MEHFVHEQAYVYAHMYISSSSGNDVSRRSSRQILFRKIGLPLSSTTERRQLCVGADRSDQPTRAYPAYERVWKTCGTISPRSPPSSIQSLPFLSCAPDCDTPRIFGISQPREMMSPWWRTGKPSALWTHASVQHKTILWTNICERRVTYSLVLK